MGWRAIVPIKDPAERKTRLASRLTPQQRVSLSESLLHHVLLCLRTVESIDGVAILSPAPPPDGSGDWIPDLGRGLNAELRAAATSAAGPLLVIHPDLPLLSAEDIGILIRTGYPVTLAGDRHQQGTNAVALLSPGDFLFRFGPASLERHGNRPGEAVAVVQRAGLALDIDTPDDLDAACAALARRPDGGDVLRALRGLDRPSSASKPEASGAGFHATGAEISS